MTDLANTVQRLVDQEEIRDVLLRYARGIDRLDVELFRTVFWEDGGFDDGIVEGPAKDFIPSLIGDAVRNMFAATQHYISNMRVEFDGPTVAFTECYFLAFHRLNPGEATLNPILGPRRIREMGGDYSRTYELYVGGRYLDRFEKRGNTGASISGDSYPIGHRPDPIRAWERMDLRSYGSFGEAAIGRIPPTVAAEDGNVAGAIS